MSKKNFRKKPMNNVPGVQNLIFHWTKKEQEATSRKPKISMLTSHSKHEQLNISTLWRLLLKRLCAKGDYAIWLRSNLRAYWRVRAPTIISSDVCSTIKNRLWKLKTQKPTIVTWEHLITHVSIHMTFPSIGIAWAMPIQNLDSATPLEELIGMLTSNLGN